MKPQGTSELFGREFENRDYIFEILKRVYQKFGYDPLQTPAIELADTFNGHHGEGENLLFRLKDAQGQELVLRYDMTVPFSRFAVENPQLQRPVKRYQMQMAYRDDAVDKGHFREFMQCDGDIIGSTSLYHDAEVINLAYSGLRALGFKDFIIRVNHREIIKGIAEEFGYQGHSGLLKIQRALDCADKFGKSQGSKQDFVSKLKARDFTPDEVDKIVGLIFQEYEFKRPEEVLKLLSNNRHVAKGLAELQEITGYLPQKIVHHCRLDLTLARGADYYTGFILEGVLPNSGVGAVLGGGRFDNLVKDLGGTDYGCVGMAFGLDRLAVAMTDREMFPAVLVPKILVATTGKVSKDLLFLVTALREKGLNVDFCADFAETSRIFAYAASRKFCGIVLEGRYIPLVEDSELEKRVKSCLQKNSSF